MNQSDTMLRALSRRVNSKRTNMPSQFYEPIPFNPESGNCRSLAIIAQLLGAEGFNEFVAMQVQSYERKRVFTPRQERRFSELSKAFGEIVRKLSTGDRAVIGKFFSMKEKMSFDAGLKIGLLKKVFDDSIPDELRSKR